MSLTTWKKEFYPESADKAARRGVGEAIEHSLRKWRGATQENAERHGVSVCRNLPGIRGKYSSLVFDLSTCALCSLFYDVGCKGCPLVTKRSGKRCYSPGRGFSNFADMDLGPDLMIHELEEALEKWREENEQPKL